jgi:hypothetical protein
MLDSIHPAQKLVAEASKTLWDVLRDAWKAGHVLPTSSADRKSFPVQSGCVEYMPAALVACALVSKLGNDKHNPGQGLHHSRDKSSDHPDCILRHTIDLCDPLLDELEERAQRFWRAGIELQIFAESLGAPKAPRAK